MLFFFYIIYLFIMSREYAHLLLATETAGGRQKKNGKLFIKDMAHGWEEFLNCRCVNAGGRAELWKKTAQDESLFHFHMEPLEEKKKEN